MSGLERVGQAASSVWQHPVGKGLAIGTGVAVPVGLVGLGVGNHLINEADSRVKRDMLMGAGAALGIGAGGALATHLVRGPSKQAAWEADVYTLRPAALNDALTPDGAFYHAWKAASRDKAASINLEFDADDPYDLGAYASTSGQTLLPRAVSGAISPTKALVGGALGLGLGAGVGALRGGLHGAFGTRLRDVLRTYARNNGDLSSLNLAQKFENNTGHRLSQVRDALSQGTPRERGDFIRGLLGSVSETNPETITPLVRNLAGGAVLGMGLGALDAGVLTPGAQAAASYSMGTTFGGPRDSLPGADTLRAGARGVRRAVNWVGDSVADRFAPHPWYTQAGQRAAALPGQALDAARSALGSIPNPFAPKPWTTRLYEGASEGLGDLRERLLG